MSSAIDFEITSAEITPATHVVSVAGEIDSFTSPSLAQELDWVLRSGATSAVVDFSEVGFIDSSCLRVLLKTLPKFDARGGKLVLVSDDRQVLRTLEITGLDVKFDVEPTLADAIASAVQRESARSDGSG